MSRVNLQEIMDTSELSIRMFLTPMLLSGTYFKARNMARQLLDILYGLSHMTLRYEEVALNWTKKIANILKGYVKEGILELYSKNNRSSLYKKIKEKEVKDNV